KLQNPGNEVASAAKNNNAGMPMSTNEVPTPEEEEKHTIGEPKTDMDSLTEEEREEVMKLFETKKELFAGKTKEEPGVDIQDNEDRVVMVLTGDIMTASCDDPGGPNKKANRELASDNHVKNSKEEMKNNNLAEIRELRTNS
ncbi:1294_t:CDS:2, partial [Acaulospora morrowiae]